MTLRTVQNSRLVDGAKIDNLPTDTQTELNNLQTQVNNLPTTALNTTTVNASTYNLLVTDYILNVTYPTTGVVTITLPTAQVISGRTITIKDASGNASINNITIDTEGSETIDGESTAVLSGDYDAINLYCDGSNWFIT